MIQVARTFGGLVEGTVMNVERVGALAVSLGVGLGVIATPWAAYAEPSETGSSSASSEPASTSAVNVEHRKDSVHNVTTVFHDADINGNLGTWTVDTSAHNFTTDTGSGFHFTGQSHYTYTIVYDDPALGTTTGRATGAGVHNVTPGGAEVHTEEFTNFEGSLKIGAHFTYVVDANGVIRVQRDEFEVEPFPRGKP